METSVFTVSDLKFAYGPHARVFDGLNLSIEEGVVTTFIGANGSGKSTLFNLLTKNLKPDAGQVLLRGADIADVRLRDFAKLVAIVHQHNSAPPDLTVERLVSYGRTPFQRFGHAATEEDEEAVEWALELTELADLAAQPVMSLSGGERQRAWIAMAIAQGSKVLLLDEPTTHLDVKYQLDVLNLVNLLHSELCMTVIMVLHDINQALHYSDRIVALRDGDVVAQGSPFDIVDPALIKRVYDVDLDVIERDGRPYVVTVPHPEF